MYLEIVVCALAPPTTGLPYYYYLKNCKNSKQTPLFWQENTTNNIVNIPYRTDTLHVRLSLSLSLSLSACEEKNKGTASRLPHTRAYVTSNTGALRIHSDELNNSTDRLTESETGITIGLVEEHGIGSERGFKYSPIPIPEFVVVSEEFPILVSEP